MATIIAEVYDSLRAAGAPGDKTRKAAETLASYESRFVRVEVLVSVNIALTVAILGIVISMLR